MPSPLSRTRAFLLTTLAVTVMAGCGGDSKGDSTGPDTGPQAASASVYAGDGQVAAPGAAVAEAPAVIVMDDAGQPVSGVSVHFSVVAGGGAVTGASPASGSDGVARVGSWKLGSAAGANRLRATISGVSTPVEFTATAAAQTGGGRQWTVMVYLAADNTLSAAGVTDLDEMDAAGSNPKVQVVVQAEFNPDQMKQAGCSTPACIQRPNWNTFRYAVPAAGAHKQGPDGPTIDIGNRDMTQASELKEFIQWSKQNYPADHYMLVLWNHGGGYAGLIEDETSAGTKLMSVGDFQSALGGLGPIDIVDFDMCLMGGYETLVKLRGLTSYAVFSEETVPGAGNPYTDIVRGIQQNANADARAIAQLVADKFDASYVGKRNSTTISAYDLAGLDAFEQSLNTLAANLKNNIGALRPVIQDAASHSQKFEFRFLTDLDDFLDSLKVRVNDQTLIGQINAVKAKNKAASFQLTSHARNGAATDAEKVDRATGLHVLLPSGGQDDQLPNSGPASLAAYEQLFPSTGWTAFLDAYMAGSQSLAYKDQGEARLEAVLAWLPQAQANGVDIDLWVLEPNGNIYIPALGSVTPNGRFSNDSYVDDVPFESYTTNRNVQIGQYVFLANLYDDPNNQRPAVNLFYRFGTSGNYTASLAEDAQLSFDKSIKDDANATLQDVLNGKYTDLQVVAVWNVSAAASANIAAGRQSAPTGLSLQRAGAGAGADAAVRRIPAVQLRAIRNLLAARHSQLRLQSGAKGTAK